MPFLLQRSLEHVGLARNYSSIEATELNGISPSAGPQFQVLRCVNAVRQGTKQLRWCERNDSVINQRGASYSSLNIQGMELLAKFYLSVLKVLAGPLTAKSYWKLVKGPVSQPSIALIIIS
jgi:hypothetical protein